MIIFIRKMAQRFNIEKIIGNKYKSLIVLKEGIVHITKGGNKHRTVICMCNCGIEKTIQLSSILDGRVYSCGCYSANRASKRMSIVNRTHGMTNTPEYSSWCSMRKRCLNKNHKSYKNYGGRGIKICSSWLSSFINFYKDMGKRPSIKYSLDRIDNDGDYTSKNCRWATAFQQQRNSRNNRNVEYNGETKCLSEWAEEYGFSFSKLYYRIFVGKWKLERAFNTK